MLHVWFDLKWSEIHDEIVRNTHFALCLLLSDFQSFYLLSYLWTDYGRHRKSWWRFWVICCKRWFQVFLCKSHRGDTVRRWIPVQAGPTVNQIDGSSKRWCASTLKWRGYRWCHRKYRCGQRMTLVVALRHEVRHDRSLRRCRAPRARVCDDWM